jgi:hypothetical protein
LALQIEVPFNSRATIKIPLQVAEGCTVVEGRTAVWPKSASNEDPGVENVDSADGSVGIMVGSGNYEFKERCH